MKAIVADQPVPRNCPLWRSVPAAAILFLLLAAGICQAQEPAAGSLEALQRLPAETISGTLRDVKVEHIGPGASQAWLAYYAPFLEYALYQDPATAHWMHVMAFKKKGKDERETHFALIDIEEKTVTELGTIKGWHEYVCMWLDGKFYMGMNSILWPGQLAVFDPATKKLTDLGSPFKKNGLIRAMAVSPDGKLALGGDPPEVALYDPKTGEYDYYGVPGSARSTKVYYVSADDDYIYASVRGTDPSRLVAIDRKTREHKELMQVPVKGILALGRQGTIWTEDDLNAKNRVKKEYYVKDGAVHESASRDESKKQLADLIARVHAFTKFVRKEAPPKCYPDYSPTYEGKAEIKFIYARADTPDTPWREIAFPLPLATHNLNRAIALPDGRLAYIGQKYAPTVVWDPKTGNTLQAPNRAKAYHCSAYAMATVGSTVFVGGYANAIVYALDADKPITQTADFPGRKGMPFNSPEANPRLVQYFSKLADGAHMANAMDVGADGLVYLSARRHRYFFGFDICWFDPADFSRCGRIDAQRALDHYQLSWMCSTADRETFIVSTYVEGNPQIKSPHPADARLFFFDLRGKKIAKSLAPLPGVQALSGIATVGPSTLVGTAYLAEQKQTVLYRLNLETGKVEQTRKYAGMLHGKPGTVGVPVKGYDFVTGPDGHVWTQTRMGDNGPQVLVRIRPADLSVTPVCTIGGSDIRLVFRDRDIIVTGQEHLQRVRNILGE